MEFLDRRLVEVSGLDVDVDAVLDTPVEVVGPVLAREELKGDVGIILADILEAGLHRSHDYALVAQAFGLDRTDKRGDVRLVVVVDARCPFELDERADVELVAEVEPLVERREATGVSHAAAFLGEHLALELLEGRAGDGFRAAEAGEIVVVREHEIAAFTDLYVRFKILVAELCAGAQGLERTLDAV